VKFVFTHLPVSHQRTFKFAYSIKSFSDKISIGLVSTLSSDAFQTNRTSMP
jgi:hypothetical protein